MKKILVDSGCDLMKLENLGEGVTFSRVPLKIIVGEKEFVDDAALDVGQMMEEMYAYPGKTGTACPSPDEWADEFREAEECYVITITGQLSGSHNSAQVARHMVEEEHPEKKIYILDSLSASSEMVLMVEKLRDLLEEGLAFEEICEKMDAYAEKTQLAIVLYSIENLVKNGRVSKVAAMAANMLGLHLIARASAEGTIESIGKARGKTKGAKLLIEEMKKQGYTGGKVIISHCQNETGAQMVSDLIWQMYPDVQIQVMETRGLCSYYGERSGLLIGYEA